MAGHARQRGKGKWQLEVDLGHYIDPKTGKKKRNKKYKTITAKGQREAELELARFITEVKGDDHFEGRKINFVEFVQKEWFPKSVMRNLSHTTIAKYVNYTENRILPAFQYLRVDQVQPQHIIDFLHNLGEEGMRLDDKKGKLADTTIYYHYRILKGIFNYAVSSRIIESSPMDGIDRPKVKKSKVDVYDDDEAAAVVEALESELLHWRVAIKLLITTGMRRSELMGLDLDKHINYEEGIVHVEQALTYTKEEGYQIHDIKKGNGSESEGKRDIYLSNIVIDDLKVLREQKMEERSVYETLWRDGKHNLILSHPNGEPYSPSSVRTWWVRFLERHELRYIKPHALRHTSATILINQGVHPKTISERLGHSDIKITMNTYGHALRKADKAATDKFDSIFTKQEDDEK
ncbi:tyrosine-type recombinase/integrase [Sporosarcina contaminans]|uniref:Tyrosine-type recombinase/integrase n=1 Tax=Sporosarcina contaminans TaxID=633403 RepID=A0ABW3U4V8_9BACL